MSWRLTRGYTRSVQKVSSPIIWKTDIFSEEDTRHKKHCTQAYDALVPFKVGILVPHTVLPVAISCLVIFSCISSLSKVILVLGTVRSHLGYKGAESPGWFDILTKNTTQDVSHEWAHYCNEAANHQLPIAAAFWIIQIVSAEECPSLTRSLMQICTVLAQSFWM